MEKSGVYWKIPVLDGYSFSQATATTEVTLNEMSDANLNSNRGRAMFTNALDPAEWSFSTYARPFKTGASESAKASDAHTAVEEALWAFFFGATAYTAEQNGDAATAGLWSPAAITRTANNMVVTSEQSDKAELGTFNLFFVLGGCDVGADENDFGSDTGQTIYKLTDCVVNTAGIDFDIDGITTINWSGFGKTITQQATLNDVGTSVAGRLAHGGVGATHNFLRNRVTSLTLQPDSTSEGTFGTFDEAVDLDQGGDSTADFLQEYHLTLTGGSINFENNITFLTPEELCKVNTPIGHVTGNRTISGSFTCYLNDDDSGLTSEGRSAKFFEDLAAATDIVRNSFNVKFTIGGTSAPNLIAEFPSCHIDIPTHQIEDVISLETNFHALPKNLTDANEVTLTYTGTNS
tara:strand:- start:5530 stop:6747 length:1218 start_codon:yes stop_codon:yes gene_type:complete